MPDYTSDTEDLERTLTRRDPVGEALQETRLFVSETGEISPGTSEFFAALLQNTSTTHALVIVKIITDNSATSTVKPDLLLNPDNNTPTTSRATQSLSFGSGATPDGADILADAQANEMTAGTGTNTGVSVNIPSGNTRMDYLALIQPGQSLGVSGGGGLAGNTFDMSLLWYEVEVA